jgi:hypothetical protein
VPTKADVDLPNAWIQLTAFGLRANAAIIAGFRRAVGGVGFRALNVLSRISAPRSLNAALVASRSMNPICAASTNTCWRKTKTKPQALVAVIMRKLRQAIFAMFKPSQPFEGFKIYRLDPAQELSRENLQPLSSTVSVSLHAEPCTTRRA